MSTKNVLLRSLSLLIVSCSVYGTLISRKNIYQKDVSEYCRRRVLPSVFLSRHAMDAHAQMLHFSQLEVPYSCFLSVRAESGSNIILVIQLPSEEKLEDSCEVNHNQLVVYEMGETFGGYWGPMPDNVVSIAQNNDSITERYYTLRTTTPIIISESDTDDDSGSELLFTPAASSRSTPSTSRNTDDNYVQVEVPIVDVSGKIVKTDTKGPVPTSFNVEDTFDIVYDVLPDPKENYEKTEMPLMQFSMDDSGGGRRSDNDKEDLEDARFNFQIDYHIPGVTQDPRLTLPDLVGLLSQKNQGTKKYKYDPNKRFHVDFSKHKNQRGTTRREDITKMTHFGNNKMGSYFSDDESDNVTISYQYVDELLDMLKVKDRAKTKEILQSKETSRLLKKIADSHHNSSVYLASNLSVFDDKAKHTSETKQPLRVQTKDTSVLLKNIADTYHNSSAYLVPDLSVFNANTQMSKHSQAPHEDNSERIPIHLRVPSTKYTTRQHSSELNEHRASEANTERVPIHLRVPTTKYTSSQHSSEVNEHESSEGSRESMPINLRVPTTKFTTIQHSSELIEHRASEDSSERVSNTKYASGQHSSESNEHRASKGSSERLPTTKYANRQHSSELVEVSSETVLTTKYANRQHSSELIEHRSSEGSSETVPIYLRQDKNYNIKPSKQPGMSSSVSMVDHKSWENVVKAAPALFGMLNNTDLDPKQIQELLRKKRKISSIQIRKSQPHQLSTEEPTTRTSDALYMFSDIQDFAQLVELPDDELYGHVALRYMGQYVGSTLFNICEFRDHNRHVHLLNSSRIIISINQFTMKRMTLVATPARTLLAPDARCPGDHIECQVSGARVCIDTMTACDGVPNCGSLDIYDEDRLTCGALIGLQHNVYLTAFTFLAVLITLLYIGHYWIKRCVPKVSDAFFVYRNGCENVLFLNTVMRSPSVDGGHIIPNYSEMAYPGLLDELSAEDVIMKDCKKKKRNIFQMVRNFFRPDKSDLEAQISQPSGLGVEKRRFSFAAEELQRMMMAPSWGMADAGVQTGESLELQRPISLKRPSGVSGRNKSNDYILKQAQSKNPSRLNFLPATQPAYAAHPPTERQGSVLRAPVDKSRIRSMSRFIPSALPETASLEIKDGEFSRGSSMNSELNILKFFRDVRTASLSFIPNEKISLPTTTPKANVGKQDMGTDYEKEIGLVEYSPPESSKYHAPPPLDHRSPRVSQLDTRKRLRFDDNKDLEGESIPDNAGPSTADAGGAVEEDEHKTKTDFKRFWGHKFGNKSAKSKPPGRLSHL